MKYYLITLYLNRGEQIDKNGIMSYKHMNQIKHAQNIIFVDDDNTQV